MGLRSLIRSVVELLTSDGMAWPGSRVVSTSDLRLMCPESLEFVPFDWGSGRFLVSVERLWWESWVIDEVWYWDVEQASWMPSERILGAAKLPPPR